MPEDEQIIEGADKTPDQIEAERRAKIDAITYREDLGEHAFEAAMTELILATISFAPITVREKNENAPGSYPLVRDVKQIKSLFALMLAGEKDAFLAIPSQYGIRNKVSELHKAAYKHKYGFTVGPEENHQLASPEEVDGVLNGMASE